MSDDDKPLAGVEFTVIVAPDKDGLVLTATHGGRPILRALLPYHKAKTLSGELDSKADTQRLLDPANRRKPRGG